MGAPAVPPNTAAWAGVFSCSAPVNSPPTGMPARAKAASSERPLVQMPS